MATKKRLFRMTEEDVREGGTTVFDCAVARCLRRAGFTDVSVYSCSICVDGAFVDPPARLTRFIEAYDEVRMADDRPAPISFYLEVPA